MEDVVVFAALAWEARAVVDGLQGVEALGSRVWRGYLGDGAAVRVLQTGIGQERAARAAASVVQARLFLSCGCAGGLAGGLHAGDMVVGDRVLGLDQGGTAAQTFAASPAALATWCGERGLPVRVGPIASSSVVLSSRDAKTRAARTGALVVEMESAAIAGAARDRGVPCAVVKVVLDEAGDAVALPGTELVDAETGELAMPRGLAAIALKPQSWPVVVRLARQQRIAERRLRAFVAILFSAGLDALGLDPGVPAVAAGAR
jgi:adenosylhomocysteine nucleosidase